MQADSTLVGHQSKKSVATFLVKVARRRVRLLNRRRKRPFDLPCLTFKGSTSGEKTVEILQMYDLHQLSLVLLEGTTIKVRFFKQPFKGRKSCSWAWRFWHFIFVNSGFFHFWFLKQRTIFINMRSVQQIIPNNNSNTEQALSRCRTFTHTRHFMNTVLGKLNATVKSVLLDLMTV